MGVEGILGAEGSVGVEIKLGVHMSILELSTYTIVDFYFIANDSWFSYISTHSS